MQSAGNNESKALRIAQTATTRGNIAQADRIRSIIDEWLVPALVDAFVRELQLPSEEPKHQRATEK